MSDTQTAAVAVPPAAAAAPDPTVRSGAAVGGRPGGSTAKGSVLSPGDGSLLIVVHGKPITQGSKTRNRFGGVRDDNAETLHPWRDNVRSAALDAVRDTEPFGTDPVRVSITFRFQRGVGHYGTGRNAHLLKASAPPFPANRGSGDIDKLVRACLDSLTDAHVWKDDSQVVDVHGFKRWADDTNPSGADIFIERATP